MAVTFSDEVMRAMGFRPFTEDEALVASFMSVTAYEVRGITVAAGDARLVSGSLQGTAYRVAAGRSVNEACLLVADDTFTDNEEEWLKENQCTGPFVLVQVGPTTQHQCVSGRIKTEANGSLTTYDCFPVVRSELAELEHKVLPTVLSALTCVFNEIGRYVTFRKIARASAGRTANGTVVHDIRIQAHASAYASFAMAADTLADKLAQSVELASRMNAKASRLFALGLAEDDQLKRFLYFFLALEIETHAVFRRIDHEASVRKLLDPMVYPGPSTIRLIESQAEHLKNLYDRFVWCAACVWTNLKQEDVELFKSLKQARDDLAHGSISEPPPGSERQAELLAHKVLWPNQ